MTKQITNLASIVHVLWKLLQLYGHDPRPIFREAKLNPVRMKKPGARFRWDRLERAWEAASHVIDDPCFGLKAASVWHPSYFGALGYALLASETLKIALNRMMRYHKVIVGRQILETGESGREFRVTLLSGPSEERVFARVDAMMSVIMGICRMNLQRELVPLSVSLRHEEPPCSEEYFRFFGTRVLFRAEVDSLSLPLPAVNEPLPGANEELAAMNERIMTSYLQDLGDEDIIPQVKASIIRQLPSGNVTDETVAYEFFMSSRTLQRRLKAEGTTFTRLLSEVRFDLARKYLAQGRYSMTEIAFLLGFADITSFSRAFKKWAGVSPRNFLTN